MSEQRRSPDNTESNESGLLLSVDHIPERSLDFTALSDDTDTTDATGADAEDKVGDTDATDAADTDATDDADGTD